MEESLTKFDNPVMPNWLEFNLFKAFQVKNVDEIKGYQKLWEDIRNG